MADSGSTQTFQNKKYREKGYKKRDGQDEADNAMNTNSQAFVPSTFDQHEAQEKPQNDRGGRGGRGRGRVRP